MTDTARDLAIGPNSWLVDEMRDAWLENPTSVAESWRNLFEGEQRGAAPSAPATIATAPVPSTTGGPGTASGVTPATLVEPSNGNGSAAITTNGTHSPAAVAPPAPAPAVPAPAAARPAAARPTAPPPPADSRVDAIRGVGARIAANMEASLSVPTATSVRDVPAKLLEVQRSILNNQLARTRGGKVSFTHLIAYAVVKRSVRSRR